MNASDLPTEGGGEFSGDLPSTRSLPKIPRAGACFEEYEILDVIAQGGMGLVFKVRNRPLERIAALKVLLPDLAADATRATVEADRLLREARAMANLEHHNIVAVYRVGIHDSCRFIEMQYVDGLPVSKLLGQGPMEVTRATRIIEQVAHALAHAHRKGMVHRDIKPANILVTTDEVVKVVDFGLARRMLLEPADSMRAQQKSSKPDSSPMPKTTAEPVSVSGTPHFMAPEQWLARETDPRTDQYGLGVTFYQMLTDHLPFVGDMQEQMRQHLFSEPLEAAEINQRVPPAVNALIKRLMAKNAEDRFPDIQTVIVELRKLLRQWETPTDVEIAVHTHMSNPTPTDKVQASPVLAAPLETLRRGHHGLAAFVVGLLVLLVLLMVDGLDGFEPWELQSLDARFRWLGTRLAWREVNAEDVSNTTNPVPGVALVIIDQLSKEKLAPDRALSRELHYAPLLGYLDSARAVGVDLLFTDRATEQEDGALASTVKFCPRAVFAVTMPTDAERVVPSATWPGVEGSRNGRGKLFSEPESLLRHQNRSEPKVVPEPWALPMVLGDLPGASDLELPIPELTEVVGRVGHVALAVDGDGVVRRVPHLLHYQNRVYPSLSLAVVMTALDVPSEGVTREPHAIVLQPRQGPTLRIPTDELGRMLVDMPRVNLPQIALWELLEQPALAKNLSGRAVFVGTNRAGEADVGSMPTRPVIAMVHAHALAADTILRQRFVLPVTGWRGLLLTMVLGLVAAAIGALPRPILAVGLMTFVVLLYLLLAIWCFVGTPRWVLPLAAPVFTASVTFVTAALLRYWREAGERRVVTGALARYLSPAVSRQVLHDPDGLRLGGKRKELTILAVRLHRFSEVSEGLQPEEVDEFLAHFFAAMTEVVFAFEGTLDQFTGHGVRLFFNDPRPQPDHAARALRCAHRLLVEANRVVNEWAYHGRPRVQVGIGVHTGYVTVGNVGSPQRMEYTILGRNVDWTDQLAESLPGRVLLSGHTRTLAGPDFVLESMPPINNTPVFAIKSV